MMQFFNKESERIKSKLNIYKAKGKSIFITSSFQTQSVPLLHLISKIDNSIPVIFLDTGFLFPETYTFRNQLEKLFSLNIIDVRSQIGLAMQVNPQSGIMLYSSNPDQCCYINKVLPLKDILDRYDVWINGVRRDQTKVRQKMTEEEISNDGDIVYHPFLDWSQADIDKYIDIFKLPKHPLNDKGYTSIGCEPCTVKTASNGRGNRWEGQKKTECGIHIIKK
jgi:phosphoadenosine phosphosulfate reductase